MIALPRDNQAEAIGASRHGHHSPSVLEIFDCPSISVFCKRSTGIAGVSGNGQRKLVEHIRAKFGSSSHRAG